MKNKEPEQSVTLEEAKGDLTLYLRSLSKDSLMSMRKGLSNTKSVIGKRGLRSVVVWIQQCAISTAISQGTLKKITSLKRRGIASQRFTSKK